MIPRTKAKQKKILTQRDSGRLRLDTQRVGENSQVSRVASRQSAVVQVNTEESDCAKDNMALGKKTNKQTNIRHTKVVGNLEHFENYTKYNIS